MAGSSQGKKQKKAGRNRRRPSNVRALADRRWEKNKERRHKKHIRLVDKKAKKIDAKLADCKKKSDYERLRRVCPKLCKSAHLEARKRLGIPLPREAV